MDGVVKIGCGRRSDLIGGSVSAVKLSQKHGRL